MLHQRPDYNRIQDPENKIGIDEPVFLLRAKDKTAPAILRLWADAQRRLNPNPDRRMIGDAEAWALEMEQWQKKNGCVWAAVVRDETPPVIASPLTADEAISKVSYGDYVKMDDRFETVHIWNENLETLNAGRWTPTKITKEQYEEEMRHTWNHKKPNSDTGLHEI